MVVVNEVTASVGGNQRMVAADKQQSVFEFGAEGALGAFPRGSGSLGAYPASVVHSASYYVAGRSRRGIRELTIEDLEPAHGLVQPLHLAGGGR